MTKREDEALKHFIKAYKHQWDLNEYYRTQYDEDFEYYVDYRNEDDYPLAYDMFFPLLLPRIMTMLARMLGQLYQGGTSDLVGVRPRSKDDIDRAPRVEGLLNFQLENLNDIDMQGGSYLFHLNWMCNALSWGKGIAKVYWRKEERIAPKRISIPVPQFNKVGQLIGIQNRTLMVKAPQIVYDAPYCRLFSVCTRDRLIISKKWNARAFIETSKNWVGIATRGEPYPVGRGLTIRQRLTQRALVLRGS
jgi:hypothetical protein